MDPSTTSRLPAGTRLGSVMLGTTDLLRALRFYADALGLHARAGGPGRLVLASGDGGEPLLVLADTGTPALEAPCDPTLTRVAIRFPSRSELANAVTRLIHHGVPLSDTAEYAGRASVYLRDPDGHGLELYVERPMSVAPVKPGIQGDDGVPLDLNRLLATAYDWSRPAPPETMVGEVHLPVADRAHAEEFYTRVVGFDALERDAERTVLLGAEGYCLLTLRVRDGTSASPRRIGGIGLRSFSIRLPRHGDLAALAERLSAAAIPSTPIRGDGLDGFIARDPDGYEVRVVAPRFVAPTGLADGT